MAERRSPLGAVKTNVLAQASSQLAGPIKPASLPKPLYPIFLQDRQKPASELSHRKTSAQHVDCDGGPRLSGTRKRSRSSLLASSEGDGGLVERSEPGIPDYFPSLVQRRPGSYSQASKSIPCETPAAQAAPPVQSWRRSRARFGMSRAPVKPAMASSPTFLSTLVTRTQGDTLSDCWSITLPSLHSPSGQDRDFSPALALAFSDDAKRLTQQEASMSGRKRLLAMGDEEGAIKIIDVDLSSTSQAENSGVWWRAHNNGVFDIKWCDNDTRLLSASADQTLRIHDVSQDSSKLLAVLGGHTSTIKSTVFLDPSRSGNSSDFSNSNIIASGGRDGNINIYDLRCHGAFSQLNDPSTSLDTTVRRSARARNARDAASNQVINPVMTLRQPHNVPTGRRSTTETRSVSRTITSLVALQSMPGILASGGSFDGIVKLWDIRCPDPSSGSRPKATPYGVLPDPTILGNPSRRSRSVNALCESPITGDLYALCGDSQIHVLRPSAAKADSDPLEAILPKKFVHPDLLTRSFYIRMSLSADGKYLACGSSHAGVMVWDTGSGNTTVTGSRLPFPKQHSSSQEPEAIAVDWGRDILAASSDDCTTRLWRSNSEIAAALTSTHRGTESGWSGIV